MKAKRRKIPRGRPRAFEVDRALDSALQVFWRKGYEGASLSDLTGAMRINRPSLYAAFGNKEALFRKVLQRYIEGPAAYVELALTKSTARSVVQGLLDGLINLLTDPRYPGGCLIVQTALTSGEEARAVRDTLLKRRLEVERMVRRRLEQARASGDLRRSANPSDLAKYVTTVMRGIAVSASDGTTKAELQRVAEMSMRAWPK